MAKDPSMPWYPNDWFSSPKIIGMTNDEELCYFRLLGFAWMSGGAQLPDDIEHLAKLGKVTPEIASRVVALCFTIVRDRSGFIHNEVLTKLWEERQSWKAKSKAGGIKSGQVRAKRSKGGSKMVRTKREPNANSSSSSSSSSSSITTSSSFSTASAQYVEEEKEVWGIVRTELSRCGVTEANRAATSATSNGWTADAVMATIEHWRSTTLDPGALYHRLVHGHPDQPAATGWASEEPESLDRPRMKNREEWSVVSGRIWREGQEKGIDEARILEVEEQVRRERGYPDSCKNAEYKGTSGD